MQDIYVTKRDGHRELSDFAKIAKVIHWGSEGLDVSPSQVEMGVRIQMEDGIPTRQIHRAVIKAAADLISADEPDYQYLAARLSIFGIRKEAFGQYQAPPFLAFVASMVKRGKYDRAILEDYTFEELEELGEAIDHNRDMMYAYAATKQLEGKYLVQDRTTHRIFESPQMANMMISACMFSRYPKDIRLDYVKRFYDAISTFKISLPTPIMSGMRTPTRQFSSCVVIKAGDSLKSINAASSAIVEYVSQRAGIGLDVSRIRGVGSPIRGGEAEHTGLIPFIRHFQTAVKSCSQGGVRGGAATVFYPMWHYEYEDLVVLKNNRGTESSRARHLDYGVQINGFLYKRLLAKGKISCFSPNQVPGLLEAFYADQDEFARLYEIYEADPKIRRNTYSAVEAFGWLVAERAGTGRIYIQNVDHCNTHSAFDPNLAPITQSNLCMEICLPTEELRNVDSPEGEIALCTLAAFNLGVLTPEEIPEMAELMVRGLDELLDYQDYPVPSAKKASMRRRTLGIGVINYAYWLANQGLKYSDGSANEATHRLFERLQHALISASVTLAEEKGACPAFNETSYARGLLPIDTYKKDLDAIVSPKLYLDWETLRARIKAHGMRNSTLMALMPSETSSQISNSTNGIEPPKGLVTVKVSKDGVMRQVVPEVARLRNAYECQWDIPNNTGYIQLVGIMQKFVDQAISANTNYDPARFPNGKVSTEALLRDLIIAYKFGWKTLYYQNTRDGADDKTFEEKVETVLPEAGDDECGDGCKI